MTLTVGSLCAGAGMFDLALAALLDVRQAWHAEVDPAASKVLAAHWPDASNHGDITAADWTTAEPVDILCGGIPCQSWSLAGKRKGSDDDRDLWPVRKTDECGRPRRGALDSIRELRPRLFVLENVPGLLTAEQGVPFGTILADLDALGYAASWTVVGACRVGACHHRHRLFLAAVPAELVADTDRPAFPPSSWRTPTGWQSTAGTLFGDGGPVAWPQAGLVVDGHAWPLPADPCGATSVVLPTPTATAYGSNRSASSGAAVRPSLEALAPSFDTSKGAGVKIQLSNGMHALVDEEDAERVREFRWHAMENGGNWYAFRHVKRKGKARIVYLHRFITGWPLVDHRNGNALDNRRSNLRPATGTQNQANKRKTRGKSRFKGVSWFARTGKWHAQIKAGDSRRHLGYFADEVEAARAYDVAARELFGDFAALNFPSPGERSALALPYDAALPQSPSPGAAVRPSLEGVVTMLPTPTAHCEPSQRGLPNPKTAARRMFEQGRRNLEGAVALLPTPTARVASRGSGKQEPAGRPLSEVIALLPTPCAADAHKDGPVSAASVGALLPTPRASDAAKGGPNQRGSSGDLMLPAAVQPERFGPYEAAVRRQEMAFGISAPEPTEPGRLGKPRLAAPFPEFMMGLSPGWITDHVGRNEAIKIAGNGLVWQACAYALPLLPTFRAFVASVSEPSEAAA